MLLLYGSNCETTVGFYDSLCVSDCPRYLKQRRLPLLYKVRYFEKTGPGMTPLTLGGIFRNLGLTEVNRDLSSAGRLHEHICAKILFIYSTRKLHRGQRILL